MSFLTPSDQKLVPITAVDSIINDIHLINSSIHSYSPKVSSNVPYSPYRGEIRRSSSLNRSQSIGTGSPDPFRVKQEYVADKLRDLHTKVNRLICNSPARVDRSRSPNRSVVIEDRQRSPVSIRHVEEAKKSSSILGASRPQSVPRSAGYTSQSGIFSGTLAKSYYGDSPVRTATSSVLDTNLRVSLIPTTDVVVMKTTSGSESPVKSILKNSSFPRENQREKALNKSYSAMETSTLAGSPSRSPTKTSSVWLSGINGTDTLYDKSKLNDIISRINARKVVESTTITQVQPTNSGTDKSYNNYIESLNRRSGNSPVRSYHGSQRF